MCRVSIMITTLQCGITRLSEKLCAHECMVRLCDIRPVSSAAPRLEISVTTHYIALEIECSVGRLLQSQVTTIKPEGTSGLRETCCPKAEASEHRLGYYSRVCVCVCSDDYNVLQSLEILTDCCILIVSPSVNIQVVPQVLCVACVLSQVVLTVPMRWPALREHTKEPVPCNMVLTQD